MQFGRSYNLGGDPYVISAQTGTIGAAAGANSLFFAMRAKQQAAAPAAQDALPMQIDGVYLAFSTIVAFGTAVIAGRSLGIYRGSAAMPTVGTNAPAVAKWTKDTGVDDGTDATPLIAAAVALTPGAFAREANPLGLLDLAAFGAAGARVEKYFSFLDSVDGPVILQPGELLVVSNPQAMDAAGTWQLVVEVEYKRRR